MSVNRKVIANYLASGWAALIGLASIPLYIRYLGIEAFGLIGFFATLQAWFLLLDMGLSQSISREMARFSVGAVPGRAIRDLLKSVAAVYAGVAVAIAVLIYGLSDVIAAYFLKADSLSRDEIAQAILLMGLVLSFQWMGTLYRSALLGLQLKCGSALRQP